jgi:hypothetical protein
MTPQTRLLLLAIDDTALPVKKHLCCYFTKPKVRPEPVLLPSPRASNAPDNCAALFYGTVLHDEGRYRMWYHACHWGMNPDWPPLLARQFARYKDPVLLGPACYAESHDGIHWNKPALGQVHFKGNRNNNALDLPHALTAGVQVIRDDDDPDPQRRYKMVYQFFPRYSDPLFPEYGRMSTIATAVSSDGLRWKVTGIPYRDQFVEHGAFYKHDGKYVVSHQAGDAWGSHFSENGQGAGRVGLAKLSYDFDHWVDGYIESLVLAEPRDPSLRGTKGSYDQNHMGVAPASFGNVCVGLYGLWHCAPEFHDISCDFGLAISNDGLHFREPVKGLVFLAAADSPATPHPSRPFQTNLCQGNGILNIGDETRIYHSRWRNTGFNFLNDYYGEIALATFPRDRWAALGIFPNQKEGMVWTMPVSLSDGECKLTLNADNARAMRVEIADEQFNLLPKFSGDNAARPAGDNGLDIPVSWRNDFGAVKHLVRFKITLRKGASIEPRLYAVNFNAIG